MSRIHYEIVAASAENVAEVIREGGLKGWKFVAVIDGYVVFEKPRGETR